MFAANPLNNSSDSSKSIKELRSEIKLKLQEHLEEKEIILLPEVRKEEEVQLHLDQLIDNFIKSKTEEPDSIGQKENLIIKLTNYLVDESHKKRGILPEFKYWKCSKRLEEAILKIVGGKNKKDTALKYENLFGKWEAPQNTNALYKKRYDFSPLLYLHLGLCGGAFAIADKSKDQIIFHHNRNLQPEFSEEYRSTPFVDIPYRYTYKDLEKTRQSVAFRKVLDAMYISVRQSQTLSDSTDYSPEFYLYMPHLLPEKEREKLLPYEYKMVKNDFKFIYCTVGEVLFHLFCWRMLVRKAQYRGINHMVTKDSFWEFRILTYNFWEQVRGLKLPENDWIQKLNTSFKDTDDGEGYTIAEKWQKDFVEEIDLNNFKKREEDTYTMWKEYILLGLIEQENEDSPWYFTRAFLEMIRYMLHVADKHLLWNQEEEPNTATTEEKNTLNFLKELEGYLVEYYGDEKNKISPDPKHSYFPSCEKIEEKLLGTKRNKEKTPGDYIAKWMLLVAKKYLLENKETEAISTLLERLHQKCRFPIIPYYYELASGKNHTPKEHLVFCLWDSNKNPIKIHKIGEKRSGEPYEESGVAFFLLTLHPIWIIQPRYNLMENDESLHLSKRLSEESYNRLFRFYNFFSLLSRPIIDEVFYDRLIKDSDMEGLLESEISSFSHELGKITQQIFFNSNNSFEDFFGDKTSEVAAFLSERVEGKIKPSPREVVNNWRLIPNRYQFCAWSANLFVWAGNEHELLSELKTQEATLENILKLCLKESNNLQRSFISIKNYTDNDKKKKITKAQNSFIRLLLSTLVNIHEHATNNFIIKITRVQNEIKGINDGLIFQFINPFKPGSDSEKEKRPNIGTLPVLKTCLRLINKQVIITFDHLTQEDINKDQSLLKEIKKIAPYQDFWNTCYTVDVSNIFENP